jgi:hypothetical protein
VEKFSCWKEMEMQVGRVLVCCFARERRNVEDVGGGMCFVREKTRRGEAGQGGGKCYDGERGILRFPESRRKSP